jgi:hypothetical protein
LQLEDIGKWRKEIELIGIDIKGIEEDIENTNRLKLITTFMNSHFISELDRIGLQLINIRGTFGRRIVVLLEANLKS